MQSQQLDTALSATWILGAGLTGLLTNVTSLGGATIVLGLAIVPPMLLIVRRTCLLAAVPVREQNP